MKVVREAALSQTFLLLLFWCIPGFVAAQLPIRPGAERIERYLPLLKDKKVALVVNQTSRVGGQLLPDTLLSRGVGVVRIFSPEHGFRGVADAGASVKDGKDAQTGLPVVSLYGKNKKPTPAQLSDIDVVVYDLQDVGVRFYTYISTLQYVLEACVENGKALIILDRPNPMGAFVDGPVLEPGYESFVGMQPIPVVYGMTPGEYARMLVGEKWVDAGDLQPLVIPCENYTHRSQYTLPVAPSPNLKNNTAIYLYPSLCFFEGSPVSVGRGTETPFQLYGHPAFRGFPFRFTPKAMAGATNPPLKNEVCYGEKIAESPEDAYRLVGDGLNLSWLLKAYAAFPNKDKFFTPFFDKLAGTNRLREQIIEGFTEAQIRESWQGELNAFREIRAKYVLYAD